MAVFSPPPLQRWGWLSRKAAGKALGTGVEVVGVSRFFLSPGLGAWVGFKVREGIRKSQPGEVVRGQAKRDTEPEVSLEK